MIARNIEPKARELMGKFPILVISGPRQSGKTTFAKMLRPDYAYVNMELPEMQEWATQDPHGFLARYQNGVILDEIQRVPSLLSYLQVYTDQRQRDGEYILTGSHNYLLMEGIAQSLAGRVALLTMLPFSRAELLPSGKAPQTIDEAIFKGAFPRLFDKDIDPVDFYPPYISTYVERDVRSIVNVTNLKIFQKFIALCAGRIGQLINFAQLANETGIDEKTARKWLSVLEAGYIVFTLQPYHRNFNKRLTKSPKLYFYDTGLASSLLGIRSASEVATHYAVGSLFENYVLCEALKSRYQLGRKPDFYFWRDSTGNEIDLVWETPTGLCATEIKSSATMNSKFLQTLDWFEKTAGGLSQKNLIYGGDEAYRWSDVEVKGWKEMGF